MADVLGRLRVVDFGQGIAGPYCGQLLGDFGADVVKVEPLRGDWIRPLGVRDANGQSGAFLGMNRNKRAICLDLKKEQGREIALKLVAHADIVVQNFRPGILERLGLGYDQLSVTNPGLIHCSISGFGPTGPYAQQRSGDTTMQALGGLMSIVGERGGQPLRVANVVSDMVAGSNAFSGILLALLERTATGRGKRVAVALIDTLIAFQTVPLTDFRISGRAPERRGNEHALISPSGAFRTKDSFIVLSVLDHEWQPFCQHLGMAELVSDPRFIDNQSRLAHRAALTERIECTFSAGSTAEWVQRLREHGMQCAPINDYPALLEDPQIKHRKVFLSVEQDGRQIPVIRNPIELDGEEVSYRPPPRLGEHSSEILTKDLGYEPQQVSELLKRGVVYGECGS